MSACDPSGDGSQPAQSRCPCYDELLLDLRAREPVDREPVEREPVVRELVERELLARVPPLRDVLLLVVVLRVRRNGSSTASAPCRRPRP